MKTKLLNMISYSLILLCILGISIASASEIMPFADAEFNSTATVLKSTKQVSFRCVTYETMDRLSVTSYYLERKNNDGSWSYVCSLPAPTTVYYDAYAYSATVDYSSYIGTGTYRVWATYDADGHSITRYSNERTY